MNFVTSQSTPFEIFKAFFDGVNKNLHNDEEIQNLLKKSGISLFTKTGASQTQNGKTSFCTMATFDQIGKADNIQIIRVTGNEESFDAINSGSPIFIAISSGTPVKIAEDSAPGNFIADLVANKIRDLVKLMYIAESAASKIN